MQSHVRSPLTNFPQRCWRGTEGRRRCKCTVKYQYVLKQLWWNLWRNPRGHYFPAPPTILLNSGDYGDQDGRFDAQTTACIADRRHGLSPKGVSVLPCPRRTEPSRIWKWAKGRTKQFSPGGTRQILQSLCCFLQNITHEKCITVIQATWICFQRLPHRTGTNVGHFQIPDENDVSKMTMAFFIRLFQQNLSHPE